MMNVGLLGAAAILGRSYDWLQRHWRGLPGFPPPYLGAGKGERPLWRAQDIHDFKAGRRWTVVRDAEPATPGNASQPANDPRPLAIPKHSRAARLLKACGAG